MCQSKYHDRFLNCFKDQLKFLEIKWFILVKIFIVSFTEKLIKESRKSHTLIKIVHQECTIDCTIDTHTHAHTQMR